MNAKKDIREKKNYKDVQEETKQKTHNVLVISMVCWQSDKCMFVLSKSKENSKGKT